MRFSIATVALLSAAGASGRTLFGSNSDDVVAVRDELKVPGESPLMFCQANRADDIITIENVDLSPNPPEAGKTLVIEATGTVSEQIEEGAYVNLQVKYGYIRLVNTKADLCEQIKNVDLECPITKGRIAITKSIDLPNEIPPGKYTVDADVYTKDDKHITCLNAVVTFGRKEKAELFGIEL